MLGEPRRPATVDERWPPIIADGVSAPSGIPNPIPAAPAMTTAALWRFSLPPVLGDRVDDVRDGRKRLRPREPDDHGDDDPAGGDDRDERPRAERRDRRSDAVEHDPVDDPERLVEEPDPDGRRAAEQDGRDTERHVFPKG